MTDQFIFPILWDSSIIMYLSIDVIVASFVEINKKNLFFAKLRIKIKNQFLKARKSHFIK